MRLKKRNTNNTKHSCIYQSTNLVPVKKHNLMATKQREITKSILDGINEEVFSGI